MTFSSVRPASPHPGMSFPAFVGLIAGIMAVGALGIDAMLPVLPQIGRSLHIVTDNQRQWIVTAYLLGTGVAQIVYGTLADRFGRKPVLGFGLAVYAIASVWAAISGTFPLMIAARALQGVGGAAARVVTVSVVRDCYAGRQMARVMSLSFIVFLSVPIIAPSIGQFIALSGSWRWIFGFLAVFAAVVLVWLILRLPETLHEEDRAPISPARVRHAFEAALTNRIAVGYMVAMSLLMGGLFGFINSSQQIFASVFHAPTLFPLIFALVAAAMAIAALLNSTIVGRLGTRRVSHAALFGYIGFTGIHAAVALSGHETLWRFAALQAGTMFCFGLVSSNFGAMAMEPLGHLAGTASSVQGFFSTTTSALLGFFIGQQFNGTAGPMTIGFVVLGISALIVVLVTEKGCLFKPTLGGGSAMAVVVH